MEAAKVPVNFVNMPGRLHAAQANNPGIERGAAHTECGRDFTMRTKASQTASDPFIASSRDRVSRGLPRLDSAFQHLDVRKALRLVFRCLTDSARFGGSRSIEDDFLRFWQRVYTRLKGGERYGAFQIEYPAFGLVLISADQQGLVRRGICMRLLNADSLDVCHGFVLRNDQVHRDVHFDCRWMRENRANENGCSGGRRGGGRKAGPLSIEGRSCAIDTSKATTKKRVIDGRFCLIELSEIAILPGSLHSATRRTQTVRKRKPGRSGRDDRIGGKLGGTREDNKEAA